MNQEQRLMENMDAWSKRGPWQAKTAALKLREYLDSQKRIPEVLKRRKVKR